MKKILIPAVSFLTCIALGVATSSCKKDDPFVKPVVSFSGKTKTVSEGVGTVQVEVDLDRSYSKDVTIEYSLDGTATDKDVATASSPGDYIISDDHGQLTIKKGETKATINIEVISDSYFEADETIEISLDNVSTTDLTIATENTFTITITNDDKQSNLSFTKTTLTVNEADGLNGLLDVEIKLDQPASSNITVTYELAGSALDSVYAFNNKIPSQYYDYFIDGTSGTTSIAAGATTGKISIQLLTDFRYDNNETIEITLKSADNGVTITSSNKMTITVKQQDGKAIALLWDQNNDVDMDMFLWAGADAASTNSFIASSAFANTATSTHQEILFIPDVDDLKSYYFGLSLVYYSGTVTPLNFTVQFADFKNDALEAVANRDVKSGVYTLVNINEYDNSSTGTDLQVEQTFDGQFNTISEIDPPSTGSRIKTNKLPVNFKRAIAPSLLKSIRF